MQEVASKQICLSQFAIALGSVRQGGHFVCKIFDSFTPFTAGLIFLLSSSFQKICIHKPVASRPANSERYIICKWKLEKSRTHPIYEYLIDCHSLMWGWTKQFGENPWAQDIQEVVPLGLLKRLNHPFFEYFCEANNR